MELTYKISDNQFQTLIIHDIFFLDICLLTVGAQKHLDHTYERIDSHTRVRPVGTPMVAHSIVAEHGTYFCHTGCTVCGGSNL